MFVEVIIPERDVHKIYYYLLGPQVVVFLSFCFKFNTQKPTVEYRLI
jgi:hypothetical protein